MNEDWIPERTFPAGGHHRLALPPGPLTFANVWTALPPARREAARDYFAQGRVVHRCRRGRAHIAVLHGHQDVYHVYCEDGAAGWQVGCTCERRAPCAHVGALLLALAEEPGTFTAWSSAAAALAGAEDWAWDWARGASFPWAAFTAHTPLWQAPAGPEAPLPKAAAALDATTGRDLDALLADLVQAAHPGWWEHPRFARTLAGAFARLAHQAPPPAALARWMGRLAGEPRIPCSLLFDTNAAESPAVAAAWQSALWTVAAAHALDPRPSQAVSARALLALPRLAAAHPELVREFGWALPANASQAALLVQQGRPAEAWWHLSQRPSAPASDDAFGGGSPDPYRRAVKLLAKEMVTGLASEPPGPRPGASGPASP